MRTTALGIRFALELCILASLAALAAHLAIPSWVKVLVGIFLCTVAAAVWGMFLSPKRKHEIGAVWRLLLEAVFFLGAAAILDRIGYPALAVALVVVAVADRIALARIS